MRITPGFLFIVVGIMVGYAFTNQHPGGIKNDTLIKVNDSVQLYFKQVVKRRFLPSIIYKKDTIKIAGWDTGIYSDPFINASPNGKYAIIPHYKLTKINGKITEDSEEKDFECAMVDLVHARVIKKEIRWCSASWTSRNDLYLTDSLVFSGR